MRSRGSLRCRVALVSVIAGAAYAVTSPQPQVSFTQGNGNSWNADWIGVTGRTYFAQGSVDLAIWEILPVLEFGTGFKGVGLNAEGEDRYFYRLNYIDADWVTTEQEARDADFDHDGIPNWYEVEELFSDPLDKDNAGGDSDSNGLADGWELYHFGQLGLYGTTSDPDLDGLTNGLEQNLGTNPNAGHQSMSGSEVTVFLPNEHSP